MRMFRLTDRQEDTLPSQSERQADRQTNQQTDRQTDRQTHWPVDRQTVRQTDKPAQTDQQTSRQSVTQRQTHIHKQTNTQTHTQTNTPYLSAATFKQTLYMSLVLLRDGCLIPEPRDLFHLKSFGICSPIMFLSWRRGSLGQKNEWWQWHSNSN